MIDQTTALKYAQDLIEYTSENGSVFSTETDEKGVLRKEYQIRVYPTYVTSDELDKRLETLNADIAKTEALKGEVVQKESVLEAKKEVSESVKI